MAGESPVREGYKTPGKENLVLARNVNCVERHRKVHRLNPRLYVGRSVAFTLAITPRRHIFLEQGQIEPHLTMLASSSERFSCSVPLYCFMPDHLHVIISGRLVGGNPLQALQSYKAASARCFKRLACGYGWQRGFYDHIVRCPEDWQRQVLYILHNPVRRELCEDYRAYPLLGSLTGSLDEILYSALPE